MHPHCRVERANSCNCEYQIEFLEAAEAKLAFYVYHCILNACFVHSKAYRHRGDSLSQVSMGIPSNNSLKL